MSAGIGSSVYDDQNYETVYFNEELAHDFASWVSGDSMESKYHNGSVALVRETGFDYDGAVYAVVTTNFPLYWESMVHIFLNKTFSGIENNKIKLSKEPTLRFDKQS